MKGNNCNSLGRSYFFQESPWKPQQPAANYGAAAAITWLFFFSRSFPHWYHICYLPSDFQPEAENHTSSSNQSSWQWDLRIFFVGFERTLFFSGSGSSVKVTYFEMCLSDIDAAWQIRLLIREKNSVLQGPWEECTRVHAKVDTDPAGVVNMIFSCAKLCHSAQSKFGSVESVAR